MFKIGDKVKLKEYSEYVGLDGQIDGIGMISRVYIPGKHYQAVWGENGSNSYNEHDLELYIEETTTTNKTKNMKISSLVKESLNRKFFTSEKIEEVVAITENILVRLEQTNETQAKLASEASTIEAIGNKLNSAVDYKDIVKAKEALKEWATFVEEEAKTF